MKNEELQKIEVEFPTVRDSFGPYFEEARELCAQAAALVVTSPDQIEDIKRARVLRLALRKVRVESDKTRKELKEHSLRTGRAIDGFQKILEKMVRDEEDRMAEAEAIAEREKDRIEAERAGLIASVGGVPAAYSLREMDPEAFEALLEKVARDIVASEAARLQAEEDRKAAEAKARADALELAEANRKIAEMSAKLKAAEDAAKAPPPVAESPPDPPSFSSREEPAPVPAPEVFCSGPPVGAGEPPLGTGSAPAGINWHQGGATRPTDPELLERYARALLAIPVPRCMAFDNQDSADEARELVERAALKLVSFEVFNSILGK